MKILGLEEKYEEILKGFGAENIKPYVLVSNFGYAFDLKGKRYDIRFWKNCYGCELNRFEVMPKRKDDELYDKLEEIEKEFNKVEE